MSLRIVLMGACCLVTVTGTAVAGNPSSGSAPGISSSANPYHIIFARNVFHLNPQPVEVPYEPPPPPLPEIKICGFVVDGKQVRALFASVPKNTKEPELYYDLTEGERDGILQLVKIHLEEQAAEVINSGVPMTLTLRENGFQVPDGKSAEHLAGVPPRQIATPPRIPLPRGYAAPHG